MKKPKKEPKKRKGVFTTSEDSELILMNGQLGYWRADGTFVVTCDLDRWRRRAQEAKEMLEELLKSSPHLRALYEAGHITFSFEDGRLYCHTTVEGFKANAPGSPDRERAIDNWMRANLTPEEYAAEKKKPVKKLEGAELDAYAQARYAESERQIASLKQDHRIGRAPKQLRARIPTAQPTAQRSTKSSSAAAQLNLAPPLRPVSVTRDRPCRRWFLDRHA